MSEGSGILTERKGKILLITIARPEVRNALDLPTATALTAAVDDLDSDPSLSVAVLTGSGGTFCAGMDLRAFQTTGQRPEVPGRGLAFTRRRPIKPIIAAVEGAAVAGGFELVLACDLVVASASARFALPEARLGLLAAAGGLVRLASKVPRSVAMELGLTGRVLDADEALRWGLVSSVVAEGEAATAAIALAALVAESAPTSTRLTKQLVDSVGVPWDESMQLQDTLLAEVLATEDANEGTRAFLEKRPPVWSGA